jgi:hypothetical protein
MCAGSYRSQVVLSLCVMSQSWAPVVEIVTQGCLYWTSYNAGFGVPAIFGRPSESLRVGSGATSEFFEEGRAELYR